jgi:hypothetical protein
MEHHHKHGFWYGFNLTAIILIIFFVIGIPLLFALANFVQSVDITATQTQQTDAYLPTSFTIDITNASNTPLNAVEFELNYDPAKLQITQIVPHSTLCEERFVLANTFNNASGTALFQCGTVTPFKGSHGVIATVHTTPLVSGTSTISFGTFTHVLAHDGFGTDVTKDRTPLIFTAL